LQGSRFDAQLGLSAAVVSLGKKLYSHCLSHPAIKPGKYCTLWAQLKNSLIADAVIPVKKSQKKVFQHEFVVDKDEETGYG